MIKTKKAWTFFALQVFFMVIAPCVFVWLQYGDLAQKYKVSVTAIMLSILIFWTFKKIVLSKWIKSLEMKIANIEVNALTITDKVAIESNKKAWQKYSISQLIFSSIIPMLIFLLAIVTIKTVEQGLIELYGCLMFCLMSISFGIVFKVAEIYATKLTHE